jgi:LCP family protein required for cell wall assembly
MLDESDRSRRSRHSRSSAGKRRTPREIKGLEPSASRERAVRQTARVRARGTAKDISPAARRRRRGRTAIIVGAVVLALIVAGVAYGWYLLAKADPINDVYRSDPSIPKALEPAPPAGEPFYVLMMGSDARPRDKTPQRSDTIMVARVDPTKKTVAMISIPRDSRVTIPGHGTVKINAANVYGGPSLVIETVKQLTGLPISHFVILNFNGFRDVVDAVGGVWIDVPFDIYDLRASAYGAAYATVKKGYQKLDGRHALTFVRTRHTMADSDYGRMRNQQAFIKAFTAQALSLSLVYNASSLVDAVAQNLDTDLTPLQLIDLIRQFSGMKSSDLQSATAPSAPKYENGVSWVVIDQPKLDAMTARMKKGEQLELKGESTTATPTIKPADVKLTVRNGTGVSKLAADCAAFFRTKGFTVSDVGNTAQSVYGQTNIYYKKGYEAQANFVRETLGLGNVIPSAGLYTFSTNVMVVVGEDWENPATASGN